MLEGVGGVLLKKNASVVVVVTAQRDLNHNKGAFDGGCLVCLFERTVAVELQRGNTGVHEAAG